jgi:hypothetical protein
MLTSPRLRPALAPLLTALALPAVAWAAAAEPVQLQVQALPACTTREELASRLTARTRRIELVAPGAAADAALVRIVVTPGPRGAAIGDLTIARPEGPPASRRLTAPSCEQLTDGLALLIALAFDPQSAAETASPDAPERRPPATSAPQPPPPPPGPPPVLAPVPPPVPAAGGLRVSAAVGAQLLVGPAPSPMAGATLEITVGWDRARVWSPAARLSGGVAGTGALRESGGVARFSLDSLTLDLCPFRLLPGPLEARACATGTVGRLGAAGSQTYEPATAARPFAATGAAAVLAWPVRPALQISARAGLAASWIRDSFAFAPSVFYRGAPLLLTAGLTAGLRFR